MEKYEKFYIHDEEVEIEIHDENELTNKMRWCFSPECTLYPSCGRAFYTCEYEEVFGWVKHVPDRVKYTRPKVGTMVGCRDMPLKYCQRLVDTTNMHCPHCGKKFDPDDRPLWADIGKKNA